jgi:hypothetical protein
MAKSLSAGTSDGGVDVILHAIIGRCGAGHARSAGTPIGLPYLE